MKKNNQEPYARVLVVIATLGKRNDLLRLTLESIVKQKPIKYDIVMIFPLDNKETMALAKRFKADVVEDPGGMSAAVNAGIATAKAHHEYITWIGDDDMLTPGSLEASTKALDANPQAVVAFGYCDYIDHVGRVIFTSHAGRLAPWLMTWGPDLVPLPGSLFRCSTLQQIGGFDTNNKWSMDLDVFLRLRKRGKFVNTKKTLACFRWHTGSQTVSNRPMVLKEAEMVKRKYLPRPLRLIAPFWERPVRIATTLAVRRVNNLSRRKANLS
ncbi:MAG: glycosyltransferase [Candidatus Saccharimonadales bacterium]